MKSPAIKKLTVLAVLVFTLGFSSKSFAVVGEGLLLGNKVSEIIQKTRETGADLIDQANHTGNALVARAANEANVLSENLSLLFQDNMDQVFDQLSEEKQLLLIEAEKIRQNITDVGNTAYEIKDTIALDLNALLSKVPFIEDKFFLQAVRGLSYLPQKSEYVIDIYGTTLGIQEDVSTNINVINKSEGNKVVIQNVRVDQSQQRFKAKIYIPNNELSGLIDDRTLKIVQLDLEFNINRKKRRWLFKRDVTEQVVIPIYISLFPRLAGTIKIESKVPTYDWKQVGSIEESYQTPNRNCRKDCEGEPTRGGNRIDLSVSGGSQPYKVGYKQLRNLKHDCVGGNCGYCDSFRRAITNYGTKAYATWDTWSTPGTWRLKADVFEYQVIGEKELHTAPVSLYFNKIAEVKVPKNITYGVVKVKTFTNDKYEIKLGTSDPKGLIQYQGKSGAGSEYDRISFQVNKPNI